MNAVVAFPQVANMVASMKTVLVDKIASITQALNLGHELRVATTDIPCEEGVVLVVEILNNKSTYNTLELTSGRMAKLAKGDVIVGALGHRQALFGYSGHLPESVKEGDIIQVLNIGGVLGICDSVNPEKGRPFDAKGRYYHFLQAHRIIHKRNISQCALVADRYFLRFHSNV